MAGELLRLNLTTPAKRGSALRRLARALPMPPLAPNTTAMPPAGNELQTLRATLVVPIDDRPGLDQGRTPRFARPQALSASWASRNQRLLVERPREGGEDISGVDIASLVRRVDRRTGRIGEIAVAFRQRGYVVFHADHIGRIGL